MHNNFYGRLIRTAAAASDLALKPSGIRVLEPACRRWIRSKENFTLSHSNSATFQNRTFIHTSEHSRAIKSDQPEFVVPEIPITEHCFKNFQRFGDRPALIDGLSHRQMSFPQVRDSISRAASGLRRNGVKEDDVIMIISENSIEYIIAIHAILSLGAKVTMANPMFPTGDLQRQTDDSDAAFIMTSLKCISKALEISRVPGSRVKKVFLFGGDEKGCVPFTALLSDDGSLFSEHASIDPRTQVAALPYSSGTTGLPKGVMLTHYGEVANAMQIDNGYILPVPEGTVQLGILPFYHVFAFMTNIITSLAWGQTTVVLPGFDPKVFLESIQKYRVNMTFAVPPMILFLNKHPMAATADLSSLTRIITGAAPLGKESVEEFHSRYPKCVMGQGYGLTETGPAICINPIWDCVAHPASSGKPVPLTEVKIVDLKDSNKECEIGEMGELCSRGPQNMKGYWKNPKATSDMIDEDGWLHTGDIGYIDKDNHVYVCDRVKELIKYKGLQVPPAELEAILDVHPAVADSCVIGIPDAEAGEVPKAFVALKRDVTATEEEIQQFVAGRVAAYKKLRGGVQFVKEIPRSPAGKILRRVLKDQK